MKKLITSIVATVFAICIGVMLSACGNEAAKKLATPTNISVYGAIITWDENFQADGFVVEINGEEYEAVNAEFDMSEVEIVESYAIRVKAVSKSKKYLDSDWSEVYVREAAMYMLEETNDGEAYLIAGCNNAAREYVLPESYDGKPIVGIAADAFKNCDKITSVTIPNSYDKIGLRIFKGCTSLLSVDLPQSLTVIGTMMFEGCTSLQSITLPQSITEIDEYAFKGCTSLTSIHIPTYVNYVKARAFAYCDNLTTVTVDELNNSFYVDNNCLIERSTRTLTRAFVGMNIPEYVIKIGRYAFNGYTGQTEITIPSSVTSIEPYAFNECVSLTRITIPDTVTGIGTCAFRDCYGLEEITLPNTITDISEGAFLGCKSLSQIDIPTSVVSIDAYAFLGTGLSSIALSKNVVQLGLAIFGSCDNLTEITVDEENPVYSSLNNCILDKECKTLLQGCKGSAIPESVTEISRGAFAYNNWLEEIIIPSNVITIDDYAFFDCLSLHRIFIPKTVRYVGEVAFGTGPGTVYTKRTLTLSSDTECTSLPYIAFVESTASTKISSEMGYDYEIYPYVISVKISYKGYYEYLIDSDYYPTRIDHVCKGFSATPNGEVIKTLEKLYQLKMDTSENYITLYAVWEPIE